MAQDKTVFSGGVAVITGAGAGIGAGLARRAGALGMTVVVTDISEERAKAVAEEIRAQGGKAEPVVVDVSKPEELDRLAALVHERFGDVRLLINNAGIETIGHVWEIPTARWEATLNINIHGVVVSDEIFDRTLDVNLKGMLRLTRHAVPALLRRGGGALIYTSSTASLAGEPTRPCYAMSKGGLNALVRHVAVRWGINNIRANAIMPGFIVTDENRDGIPSDWLDYMMAQTRAVRLGRPEDIAAMVAMLASADGEWINGQTIAVDGGSILH